MENIFSYFPLTHTIQNGFLNFSYLPIYFSSGDIERRKKHVKAQSLNFNRRDKSNKNANENKLIPPSLS
jgi:hypothetical protein